jgi:hypothetical protein
MEQGISPVTFTGVPAVRLGWDGPLSSLATSAEAMRRALLDLDRPVWAVAYDHSAAVTNEGPAAVIAAADGEPCVVASAPALPIDCLGDPAFRAAYGVRYAYYAGAMANAISSEQMVIALGKAGILASFGSAGLLPARIEAAIGRIQEALPSGPYLFNLINSYNEPALEQGTVEVFLKHGIRAIEASAYLSTTPNLIYYRAAGLSTGPGWQRGDRQPDHRQALPPGGGAALPGARPGGRPQETGAGGQDHRAAGPAGAAGAGGRRCDR